jgi:cytochrome P450
MTDPTTSDATGPASGPPTVDFDHHRSEFHRDRHTRWEELRACPVAFNPRFGGFWVVSGYDEVATVARDGATFSSRYVPEADDGIDYLGITGIPRAPGMPTAGIAEVEGPVHAALRRTINPFLVPAAVDRLRPLMEQATTWFLDQRIEEGSMDLVADLAGPVPAVLTMALVGLPLDGWRHYADLFHAAVAHQPGDPELRAAFAKVPDMLAELGAAAEARRAEPRVDLLTALVELRVEDDRPLTDDEVRAVLWNLVGGGLDTTTSLTSLSLHHLEAHPDQRRALADRPELLAPATEEFLRFFSVNESLTRTVVQDTELGGCPMARGDHLLLSWLSANRDERVFERADEVVLDRERNPHLAFGVGPHRCIGSHLARQLFQVLVREVLARIPDYAVDQGATAFYAGNPELNGIVRMPVTFTPGPRVGPVERPF